MILKSGDRKHSQMDTIIGKESMIEGNIICEGTVRIDGRVKGKLDVKGDVYLGEKSSVEGDIEANNVYISGSVKGNISCNGLLRLFSKAKLMGDAILMSFVADEGAVFNGKINTLSNCDHKDCDHKDCDDKDYDN